jgi:transposase
MLYKERSYTKRSDYHKDFRNAVSDVGLKNIIYLDESGFDARDMYKESCWCPKGKEVYGERSGRRFRRRTSLLLAKKGKSLLAPFIFKGTCNTKLFNAWLEKMLIVELNECEEKQVIVMDNASIHKNKKTRDIIEKAGHELLFLPPYSPDLNPIEKVFGTIKRMLKHTEGATLKSVILSKC